MTLDQDSQELFQKCHVCDEERRQCDEECRKRDEKRRKCDDVGGFERRERRHQESLAVLKDQEIS
jgi:hypothetical protein